jgi:predicted glycosyl hydrolase (DUF1957 family)
MLDIFNTYATDEIAETQGAWQKIGGGEFLIARANNRRFARALSTAVERNQAALQGRSDEADQLSDELMIEVLTDTILLDWKNVTYKGEAFPYTRENARLALQHRDFRREVVRLAEGIDAYRAKVEGEQVKN